MRQGIRKSIRCFRSSHGVATVEFVIWFPIFLMLFLSTIELSFFGMQSVLLERALDLSVRELRLGISRPDTHDEFKALICHHMVLQSDCEADITLELRPINTITWDMPNGRIQCVDRENDIDPYTDLSVGAPEEVMLVRACFVKNTFFGSSPLVLGLPVDESGGVKLIAVSTYVNEP